MPPPPFALPLSCPVMPVLSGLLLFEQWQFPAHALVATLFWAAPAPPPPTPEGGGFDGQAFPAAPRHVGQLGDEPSPPGAPLEEPPFAPSPPLPAASTEPSLMM